MSLKVHFKKYQKWQAVILVICFITVPLATLTIIPEKAQATCMPAPAITTYNPATVPVSESMDIAYVTQKQYESQIYYKTCVSDGIATIIGKQIIKALTRSIVQWINSGFKGNPSFIQNPGKFFTGIADKVAGNIIESIAPFLCSPFRLNIQFALSMGVSAPGDDISCTFSDVQNNIQDFANNTKSQANNWQNWFQITQNPSNNPYGAIAMAQGKMNIGISSANGEQAQMLGWGSGFLSSEECPSDTQSAAEAAYHTNNPNDRQIYDAKNQPVYGVQVGDNNCLIKTPGATIEQGLSDNIGSDLRGLEIAQSIDQIFAALVGQLMTQALGATGLSHSGSYSSSGNTSPYGGVNNNINYPISGSCTPDKFTADIGEPVTWSVFVANANQDDTYMWSGDEVPTNADQTLPNITMSYASSGTKNAGVLVTSLNGGNIDTQTISCVPAVVIKTTQAASSTIPSQPSAPSLTCAPTASTTTRVNGQASVTWTATLNNAPAGTSLLYDWTLNPGPSEVNIVNQSNTLTHIYTGTGWKNTHVTAHGDGKVYDAPNCSVYISS